MLAQHVRNDTDRHQKSRSQEETDADLLRRVEMQMRYDPESVQLKQLRTAFQNADTSNAGTLKRDRV